MKKHRPMVGVIVFVMFDGSFAPAGLGIGQEAGLFRKEGVIND
jgi:hypothetical protein